MHQGAEGITKMREAEIVTPSIEGSVRGCVVAGKIAR